MVASEAAAPVAAAGAPAAAPAAAATSTSDPYFEAYYAKHPSLWLHKALYFWVFAAVVFYSPFVPVYLVGAGFSKWQVGILTSISPLAQMIAVPLWTALADRTGKRRALLLATTVVATACRPLLTYTTSFAGAFVLITVVECIGSALFSVVDASALALLDATCGTQYYGRLRLWGAVSWGSVSLIAGALADKEGVAMLFWAHAAVNVVTIGLLTQLPMVQGRATQASTWQHAWAIFRNRQVVLFFIVAFLLGVVGNGIMFTFGFVYFEELGASKLLLGLTLTFTCVSEVPMFFAASTILTRIGVFKALLLVTACFAVRCVYYALLVDPWWTLPNELLHGITFGVMWAACTKYAHALVEPELASVAQGVLTAVQSGAGAALGCMVGGIVYGAYGGRTLYWAGAVLSSLAFVLLWLNRKSASTFAPTHTAGTAVGDPATSAKAAYGSSGKQASGTKLSDHSEQAHVDHAPFSDHHSLSCLRATAATPTAEPNGSVPKTAAQNVLAAGAAAAPAHDAAAARVVTAAPDAVLDVAFAAADPAAPEVACNADPVAP